MDKGRQLLLFTEFKTPNGSVRLKQTPFPHIEVLRGRGIMLLPIEELRRARRLPDGLTPLERKLIKELFGHAEVK